MNMQEIKKAKKLLDQYTERTETMIYGKGQVLTAYFFGGAQTLFYSLNDIIEWVNEHAK